MNEHRDPCCRPPFWRRKGLACATPAVAGHLNKVLFILCLLFVGLDLRAESIVKAVFVDVPPKIDGHLDDPAWAKAAAVDQFYQREPHPGQAVSEKTEFLIAYDHDKLYFAFKCYEKDPGDITAKEMARDVSLGEDDRVQVILDTFLDGRNGYWFQIGPRGSIGDALLSDNGETLNKNWDGLWDGKARIHSQGWDAEVVIPFKTLTFKPGLQRWGLKLIRNIRRRLEASYWPTANLNTFRFQVSDAGILEGLEGITQGIGLDLMPYGLTGWDQKKDADSRAVGKAGMDLYYQLTPGLKSALTINTDFAQTEVDATQINLTRFPLLYPEKRDFFLEGSSYFSFGPATATLIPFFSRRIGLDLSGNPIPLLWGAKLMGQAGPWNIGVLNAMDDKDGDKTDYTIARVRRNLGKQSSAGFIFTHGNALFDADNMVFGADLKWASSNFRGNKNIGLTGFALKSVTDGLTRDDGAYGAEFVYPNDLLNLKLGFQQIEKNFVTGVGFVPRRDIRESYFQSLIGPRPRRWGILQVLFGAGLDYITDLNNRLQTRSIPITPLQLRFNSGEELNVSITPQYEFLDKPFVIRPPHVIPKGSYSFTRQQIGFTTAPRRNLWAKAVYQWGDFYNGSREDILLSTGYKVTVPLYLGLEYQRNRVSLPDGRFATNISRLNANVLFRPNITLYNFLQYDNVSRTLGWQSRFRWIITPGNEIYFVWNSKVFDPLERRELAESSARIKLRYNYRF
jgi:hypothetical protein